MEEDIPHETIHCNDVMDMLNKVLSQPPAPPNTYLIDVDHTNDDNKDNRMNNSSSSSHVIFQTLGQFLTHGIVWLYGDQIDILDLTPEQIQTLQKYLNAFGWQAVINPVHPNYHPQALPFMLTFPSSKTKTNVNVIFEPFCKK